MMSGENREGGRVCTPKAVQLPRIARSHKRQDIPAPYGSQAAYPIPKLANVASMASHFPDKPSPWKRRKATFILCGREVREKMKA
jgi:hypothetical protein